MNNLPIGIQDFESLRKEGYIYIDKTDIIYKLVKTGRYYFLSRPRRFGKSLLATTLKAYFLGKKELFNDLKIAELEKEWTVRPVLHLDLNTAKYDSCNALENKLNRALTQWEESYGKDAAETNVALRFEGIIRRACEKTGHSVAIIIDEYDKPMLEAIGNEDLQNEFRSTLKAFYGALKSADAYIKFALVTGVTKFSKVSIFSDLNNLKDISMDARYYNICGIESQDLHTTLCAYVQRLADANDMSLDEAYAKLRLLYDGYHFRPNTPGIYNPFSVLNALDSLDFGNYWFATGTPTYLVNLLKLHNYNLQHMETECVSADVLNSIDSSSTHPIPVLFQSGYLTIASYNKEFELYSLGFPNQEVKRGFFNFLVPYYTPIPNTSAAFQIMNFVEEVKKGQIDSFMTRLKSFFADTPYELVKDLENHYQNVLYILCRLCGFYTKAEYHTSAGRIDMTMETNDYIYIWEFKFDGSAEEALKQIEDKHYADPFLTSGKKIICIGANFSHKLRNIEHYVVEEVK